MSGGPRGSGLLRVAYHLSIRQKLLALVAVITAGALLAAFGFVISRDAAHFRREMVETATLVARVVGEYTIPELTFEDRETAARGLGKLAAVPAVRSALLFDARGRPFTGWGEPVTAPADLGGSPRVWFADGGLHVLEPIARGDDHYGTLYLVASTAQLEAKIERRALVLLAVLVISLALALGLAWRLQPVISGPLLELAAITRRVTVTGDTSLRARKRGDDEIGELCDSFNDMLEQLGRRERERDAAELRTQEKSRFLANMSHELRTPLNSIIGFSEVLLARVGPRLDDRELHFLANIQGSGRHLLSIINDILDLSKVEAGRMELQPEAVSLPALVDGVTTVMKGLAERDQIAIALQLPAELPWLWADAVKVKQVLYNLLSNALKYSPPGSRVTVGAREVPAAESLLGEHAVELSVADYGMGIAAADQERIFAPFHQVDAPTGRLFGGTGLGLTLVRTFTELHGGRVSVVSAPGEGSIFRVLLPVRRAEALAAGAVPPRPPAWPADEPA